MKLHPLLLPLLLWSAIAYSQTSPVLDSLRTHLGELTATSDQHRVLMQLATVFTRYSLDSTKRYANQAWGLAREKNMPLEEAQAIGLVAYVFLYEGALDSARHCYQFARDRYGSIPDTLGIVQAEMNLASVDYYRGNYPAGIDRLLEALRLSDTHEHSASIRNQAAILNNLGNYYDAWGEDSLALVYYRQSLPLKRKIGQRSQEITTLVNMGGIFIRQQRVDSAQVYFEEALELAEKGQDESGLASVHTNLAELEMKQQQWEKAQFHLLEARKRYQQLGDQISLAINFQYQGVIEQGKGNWARARNWALESLELARQDGYAQVEADNLKLLAELAESQQRWEEATRYWRSHRELTDSLFNQEYKQEVARLTQLYESERKDNDILRLTQASEISSLTLERRNLQLGLVVMLTILLIAIAILLYNRYRIKNQTSRLLADQNEELEALNATKDQLFSIIAHDLQNPLSAFQSLSHTLEQQVLDLSKGEIQQALHHLKASSDRLFELLQNLLQWAMSQTGKIQFQPRINRLSGLWEKVRQPLETEIQAKQLQVSAEVPAELLLWADRSMVEIILRNLLSNAIKFTEPGGKIEMVATESETGVELRITDDGVGLTESEAQQLFLPETRPDQIGSHPAKGTGLGLQLCQELLERHGGSIHAESAKPGARFILFFPHAHESAV